MDSGSLPQYSGVQHDGGPGREPPPDRHTWEFAGAAILVAVAINIVVLMVLMLLLCGGVPAGPVFA